VAASCSVSVCWNARQQTIHPAPSRAGINPLVASINISQNKSFKLDVKQLPVTHARRGSRAFGIGLMLFAATWASVITAFMVIMLRIEDFEPHMLIPLFFAFMAAIPFIMGVYEFSRVTEISFDKDCVSFSSKSLFGAKQWMEDIGKFDGILNREEFHSGGKNRSSYTLYIVELYHTDHKKNIRLFQSTTSKGVRAIWEEYCRNLNLPALEKNGSQIDKRDVEDLDKSVRDQVKEGKLRIDFDPSRPPPKGLRTKVADDMFQVIVEDAGLTIINVTVPLLFPIVFIFIGLFQMEPLPIIIGTIVGLVLVCSTLWFVFTKVRIKIGADKIVLNRTTPWGETADKVIMTCEIESVVVGEHERSKQVLIKTDHQQFAIGNGLSVEAQEWLRNCIVSIIST
jgi:hypothetical protein